MKTTSTSQENPSPNASSNPTEDSSTLTIRYTCPACSAECFHDMKIPTWMRHKIFPPSIIAKSNSPQPAVSYVSETLDKLFTLSGEPTPPVWITCESCGTTGSISLSQLHFAVPKPSSPDNSPTPQDLEPTTPTPRARS